MVCLELPETHSLGLLVGTVSEARLSSREVHVMQSYPAGRSCMLGREGPASWAIRG